MGLPIKRRRVTIGIERGKKIPRETLLYAFRLWCEGLDIHKLHERTGLARCTITSFIKEVLEMPPGERLPSVCNAKFEKKRD